MHVMDLTGRPQPLAVEIEAAIGYEFVTSLCAFFEEDKHGSLALGRAWADEIRATVSPDLLAGLDRYCAGFGNLWMFLWSLVYESAPPKDIASFFAHLEAIDALELRLRLFAEHCPPARETFPREAIIAAARGDQDALQQYFAAARGDQDALQQYFAAAEQTDHEDMHWLDAWRHHAPLDPEEDRRELLRLLRAWHSQIFARQEDDLAAILARDGAAKRALARANAPDRLIELATNGLRYVRQPGINRVLLFPTVLYRPWVLIWEYRDAVIFCYAVAEESLSRAAAPSAARLVAIYKALGDERRLQVLQKLADRSYGLQEMADSLGIGKSLMHHHMMTLRAAGLVRVSIGGERRYELRTETLAALPGTLDAYLGGRPAGEPPGPD